MDTGGKEAVVLGTGDGSFRAAMAVAIYVEKYGSRLDAQRFAYVRGSGPVARIRNDFGNDRLMRHGIWLKRWRHYDIWGMFTCRASRAGTDIPFVRCYEEVEYEKRLTALIRILMETDG